MSISKKRYKYTYMAVTKDNLELPVFVTTDAYEMAAWANISRTSLYKCFNPEYYSEVDSHIDYKIVRVLNNNKEKQEEYDIWKETTINRNFAKCKNTLVVDVITKEEDYEK